MDRETETHLIDAAVSGDSAAFDELMLAHESSVYRCAFAFTRSREAALDITQTVFLKALTALRSFRKRSSLRTWLLRIAMNELLASSRNSSRRVTADLEADSLRDESPDPESAAISRSEVSRVLNLISQLGESQRAAILLRHFEDCSLVEIADALGTTTDVAKNALFRAHKRLFELWTTPQTQRTR
jgi:RNA polymerase sigma-70 factor (ECF subfamily)